MAPVTTVKSKSGKQFRRTCHEVLPRENKNGETISVRKVNRHNASTTTARIPTKPNEISSNWKNLLTSLGSKRPPSIRANKLVPTRNCVSNIKKATKSKSVNNTEEEISNQSEHKDVWFDNVDPILLTSSTEEQCQGTNSSAKSGLTEALALDCEMVGVGYEGKESVLARVSIVNQWGECVYDKYVLPGEKVTDYRTHVSGIRPHDLLNALELGVVREEVSRILRGRLLIGHSLRNDLQVLLMKHPKCMIRDTSRFKHFRAAVNGSTPSLKFLAQHFLGVKIQTGEHSSVQDAKVAMHLYTLFRQKWEAELHVRRKENKSRYQNRKLKGVKTLE